MNQHKLNELYIAYVGDTIKSGQMPATYERWLLLREVEKLDRKPWEVRIQSDIMKDGTGKPSWFTYNIDADSYAEAVVEARKRLQAMEQKHSLEIKKDGKAATPAQVRAKVLREIENLAKAEKKAEERIQKNRKKLLERARKLGIEF